MFSAYKEMREPFYVMADALGNNPLALNSAKDAGSLEVVRVYL